MRLDHRVQEAINRGARGVEIDIWPQHTTGRIRNYQQLFSSIPSLSKEDVMLVQNGKMIPHWVEEQGEVWGKLPELGSEHQTVIALVGQRGAPNLSDPSICHYQTDFSDSDGWTITDSTYCRITNGYAESVAGSGGAGDKIYRTTFPTLDGDFDVRFRFEAYQSFQNSRISGFWLSQSLTWEKSPYIGWQIHGGASVNEWAGFRLVTNLETMPLESRYQFTNWTWVKTQIKRVGSTLYTNIWDSAGNVVYSYDVDSPTDAMTQLCFGNRPTVQYGLASRYDDLVIFKGAVEIEPIVSIRRTLSRSQLDAVVRAQI